jgi:peptidoglycan hydrolase-like protein with peptidoglycan-binding domain
MVNAPTAMRDGTLRYGDKGWEVKAAQQRLADLGYNVGNPDGQFGATTRAAALAFQADNNLPTAGIIDQATKDALASAPPRPIAEERATADAEDLREQGSKTVASADSIGKLAKGAAAAGAAIGTEKSGGLDAIKDASDQFGVIKSIAETAQDAIQWVEGHLWLGLIVGAGVAWYFYRDIIKERLAHYQAGASVREK